MQSHKFDKMNFCTEDLQMQLTTCRNILNKGYTAILNTRLSWLNTFCLELYNFAQKLHIFLLLLAEKQKSDKSNHIEIVYLCLTQIVTCIKHMENVLKAEDQQNATFSGSRQHFLDRINWCLNRLRSCLGCLTSYDNRKEKFPEEKTFVELMDKVLDLLSTYSSYKYESQSSAKEKCLNIAANQAQAAIDSQEIRSIVDFILSHTLAFANVAVQQDKKPLSSLCQKVLRECMAFQEECSDSVFPGAALNDSNRKLKAISLENALYQLEDYINEALLRLVFACFLDHKKFSIEKLRKVIRECGTEDPEVDELIADFDVNVDRTTQIGIFAIAFAPNIKVKTIVRSCLASLESLDSCIIPALQTEGTTDIFAKVLEQHFNEEVSIFKNALQEIIDSQAFTSCFLELLTQTINRNENEYNKESLDDIIKMAQFLYEHFQLPVNNKQLQKEGKIMELFRKFCLVMDECHTILQYTHNTQQIESIRILKRFKILRSILRKLIDELCDKSSKANDSNKSQVFLMSDDFSESQQMLSLFGMPPSVRSILYDNSTLMECRRKRRLLNDSVTENYLKLSITSAVKTLTVVSSQENKNRMKVAMAPAQNYNIVTAKNLSTVQHQRASLRRKQSLRTALFKRQKFCETEQIYSVYKNNSDSLQISEILAQLTGLSLNLSKQGVNKSITSK